MSVEYRFAEALAEKAVRAASVPELLPTALASAAAEVLPAEGVGLSVIMAGLRIPLGASDEASATAERVECTIGSGPCLEAIQSGMVIDAWAGRLQHRWPMLHERWEAETPFRSALSIPVPLAAGAGCALNLYFADEHGAPATDPHDNAVVAAIIAAELRAAGDLTYEGGPAWLRSSAAHRRRHVWVAVGMVMHVSDLSADDALARLRATAYTSHLSLDAFAGTLVADPTEIWRVEL